MIKVSIHFSVRNSGFLLWVFLSWHQWFLRFLSSQVTFIYIALFIIQIVSKQL